MSFDAALAWLKDNEQALSAVAAIIAILVFLFFPVRWFLASRKKPGAVIVANADDMAQKPLPIPKGTMLLEVEEYTASLKRERDAAKAELAKAHGDQIQDLINQIDDKNRRLANPEEALAQQHALIVQLQEQLARRGNEIGGDALAKADAALKARNFDEAKEIFAQISARTAPDVKTNADAEYALGLIAEEQVRWLDAADHFTKAARLNPSYDTLVKAGTFLWRAGRYREAIAQDEELLTIALAEFGQDSEKTATAMNNLASSYRALGRYGQAEPLHRQAIEISEKTLGEGHPDYATSLNNLAELLRETGRYDQAEPLYRQAIEIGAKTLGEGHPDYAIWLNNLALLLQATGRYNQAEPLYRQAIEIGAKTLGAGHPDYAQRLNNLAILLWQTNRQKQAVEMIAQAAVIHETTLGAGHTATKKVAADLATMRAAITSKN